jgi:hypothetical protein
MATQKSSFKKLLQNANSLAAAAADPADRARAQRPIPQTEHCAADSAPPPNSGAAADSAAPSQKRFPDEARNLGLSKTEAQNLAARKTTVSISICKDGKAPEMAQIHVSFAKMSAAQLVEDNALRMEDLIQKFNADWPTIAPTFGLEKRGKADIFL